MPQRIQKQQPIVTPNDVKRYFVIPKESGELCLMSCIFGENRDIFFPKLNKNLHLTSFAEIAIKYLQDLGYEPYLCKNEDEDRKLAKVLPKEKKWPCFFTNSNTTGEKSFEEFYTDNEDVDMNRFKNLGVIKNNLSFDNNLLETFVSTINDLKASKKWNKTEIVELFHKMIPNFDHKETGKYLDDKM